MILLVAIIGFAILLVAAGVVWLVVKVTGPPVLTTESEARAACERAVTEEMDSPAEVTFGKQTATEVRGGREWIVSGKAKSALGGDHTIEAQYNCTIAEGSLVRQTGPRQDDWITIISR